MTRHDQNGVGDTSGSPSGDVYEWYQRGMKLLQEGSPAAAAALLERAAGAEPDSRSIREALARAQFNSRRLRGGGHQLPLDRGRQPGRRLCLLRSRYGTLANRRHRRRPGTPGRRCRDASRRTKLRLRPHPDPGDPAREARVNHLLDAYDTLLLDLDGVVYLGRHAVPGAPEALALARERGVRLAYVTNNASRTPAAIAEHLTHLGVPALPRRRGDLRAGGRPAGGRTRAGRVRRAGRRRDGAAVRPARPRIAAGDDRAGGAGGGRPGDLGRDLLRSAQRRDPRGTRRGVVRGGQP